jgi:hypothetical protein
MSQVAYRFQNEIGLLHTHWQLSKPNLSSLILQNFHENPGTYGAHMILPLHLEFLADPAKQPCSCPLVAAPSMQVVPRSHICKSSHYNSQSNYSPNIKKVGIVLSCVSSK